VKPEHGPSRTSQIRTRSDIYFWSLVYVRDQN